MEKYTFKQSENEANAMTSKLKKEYPEQEGIYDSQQYERIHTAETDEIYKTALGTVEGLARFTDIKLTKKVWKILGGEEENKSFSEKTAGKPHLVELRYKMSDSIIRELSETENVKQAVELASGFTPHALELLESGVLNNYIESDLPINSTQKKEVNAAINPEISVSYASGNIYNSVAWEEIASQLKDGSVVIFSEGFMLYSTKEERDILANEAKSILEKHGGYFMFEDSTRFHPEFIDHPNFKPFFDKLAQVSNRGLGAISQEDMTEEWLQRGFDVDRISENVHLSIESKLPEFSEEIELVKENYKMWKLSLRK